MQCLGRWHKQCFLPFKGEQQNTNVCACCQLQSMSAHVPRSQTSLGHGTDTVTWGGRCRPWTVHTIPVFSVCLLSPQTGQIPSLTKSVVGFFPIVMLGVSLCSPSIHRASSDFPWRCVSPPVEGRKRDRQSNKILPPPLAKRTTEDTARTSRFLSWGLRLWLQLRKEGRWLLLTAQFGGDFRASL